MKLYILLILGVLKLATTNGQVKMKPLEQLIIKESETWDVLKKQIKDAKNPVQILPKDQFTADSALFQAQVTTRSPMGAIIYETGGILIDSGWIRILGSGSKKLSRTIMVWNKGKSFTNLGEQPSFLLIADDVLGGFYGINGGGIDIADIGKVFYFSPDNNKWNSLQLSYSEFLNFCFSGNLNEYYKGLRWNNWQKDVVKLNGDWGFSFFPFLWTKEGRKDINKNDRRQVPIQELWDFYFTLKK
jgi:hypothetical protein